IVINSQWVPYPTPVPYSLFAVDFNSDASKGVAVGEGGTVLYTINAGVTWSLVSQNLNHEIWVNDVLYIPWTNDVYAAGMGGVIVRSINGGANWVSVRDFDDPLHTIRGIAHNSSGTPKLHFVGYAGAYYTSTTGLPGSFTPRTDIQWTMHSIAFDPSDNQRGIICGTDGLVWNSVNSGDNWTQQYSGRYDYLNDIVYTSPNKAFICGNNGTVLKTANNGVNWSVIPFPTTQHLRSIDFSGGTLTICGDAGTIYTSTDLGITWTNCTPSGETRHFYGGVCLRGTTLGTVVGQVGLKASGSNSATDGPMYITNGNGTVGVVQTGTTVPEKYSLNQNFPNPFNPTTKISFALAKAGPVMLTVFDMSGREIATLVNSTLSVGNFEYTFDGSKLSSGIYFYRIITNDFVESKKMTLLK
ncbi:MAG: YCF48-related protein, partial [Ignavibacteriae bacterium]|nr:YCF48-related protein [Ignavibacteriota bacterium]